MSFRGERQCACGAPPGEGAGATTTTASAAHGSPVPQTTPEVPPRPMSFRGERQCACGAPPARAPGPQRQRLRRRTGPPSRRRPLRFRPGPRFSWRTAVRLRRTPGEGAGATTTTASAAHGSPVPQTTPEVPPRPTLFVANGSAPAAHPRRGRRGHSDNGFGGARVPRPADDPTPRTHPWISRRALRFHPGPRTYGATTSTFSRVATSSRRPSGPSIVPVRSARSPACSQRVGCSDRSSV
jgi:hypothetical protein